MYIVCTHCAQSCTSKDCCQRRASASHDVYALHDCVTLCMSCSNKDSAAAVRCFVIRVCAAAAAAHYTLWVCCRTSDRSCTGQSGARSMVLAGCSHSSSSHSACSHTSSMQDMICPNEPTLRSVCTRVMKQGCSSAAACVYTASVLWKHEVVQEALL
jgi:hypothetical protein